MVKFNTLLRECKILLNEPMKTRDFKEYLRKKYELSETYIIFTVYKKLKENGFVVYRKDKRWHIVYKGNNNEN